MHKMESLSVPVIFVVTRVCLKFDGYGPYFWEPIGIRFHNPINYFNLCFKIYINNIIIFIDII